MTLINDSTPHIKVSDEAGLGRCIQPLLKAMDWQGTERQLKESLPHFDRLTTLAGFCDVMANLKYQFKTLRVRLDRLDSRIFPCLFVNDRSGVMVLISQTEEELRVFDGESGLEMVLSREGLKQDILSGTAYIFDPEEEKEKQSRVKVNWLYSVIKPVRGMAFNALGLTFILSLLALSTPLFIMFVYDRVIGAGSVPMLAQFSIGIVIVFLGIYMIHRLRGKILAILGARLDHDIGNNIFQRILYLSPVYTETATVGSQVARVRDFDRLRDFLTGPLLTILFEMPFIFISLSLIAILTGTLVFVPVTMIVIFVLLSLFMKPKVRYAIAKSAEEGAKLQEFLLEAVSSMKVLKYTAAEDTWLDRYRDLSADATMASLHLTMIGAFNNAISNAIMIGAGLAVLGFGAMKIMAGTLSVGAMIATMILIWRVLAPLRTVYNTLPRIQQIQSSLEQIHRLMEIEPESEPGEEKMKRSLEFRGHVVFDRVSFRYPTSFNPALMGVIFDIKPGTLVGVIGRNGSGKSTILKLILGMYQPQAGGIRIDNQDIRQINPIELRKTISYLPQVPELFYGTIAQNLRLANPTAEDETLRWATEKAGILDDILKLPEGFDAQIRDHSGARLASSFQQGLCLARAYLKKSSIVLLDEPANVLDRETDQRLIESVTSLRKKVTVFMVTHRPSHLKVMDTILLFEQGQLLLQGPPNEVLPKIPKELL